MIYTWPPGSGPDGFGDGCERRQLAPLSRLAFADVLGRRFDDPYADWYVRESLKSLGASLQNDDSQRWHRLRFSDDSEAPVRSSFDLPQARLFGDIGVVAMHTDLANTAKNLMVAFRSSPFGSFNHAHADQNSFNILFGGERLFSNSGYYIGYGDDHFKGWYIHSRGHNTVLIDNKGQSTGTPNAYGQVIRYLHDESITYCLGDASNAYGDAGLTLFRRHVALLRPSTVVIYDELEANHRAQWSWLLHCEERISADAANNRLDATTSTARSRVDFFAATALNFNVHNRFDPPALNWRKRTSGGKLVEYPDQWHVAVSPTAKAAKMRYLAVVQVLDREGTLRRVGRCAVGRCATLRRRRCARRCAGSDLSFMLLVAISSARCAGSDLSFMLLVAISRVRPKGKPAGSPLSLVFKPYEDRDIQRSN
jgi:hypothetical protein